jgi:hypothetical protein
MSHQNKFRLLDSRKKVKMFGSGESPNLVSSKLLCFSNFAFPNA